LGPQRNALTLALDLGFLSLSSGRQNMTPSFIAKTAFALGLLLAASSTAMAANHCAGGKTITEGVLTFATSEPAYFPWVIDNKPESGKGFESAVAYEVAARLGFAADKVVWVRAGFDESIQPGVKNFDLNIQQYSITEERMKVVDFSASYYDAAQSVVVRKPAVEAGAKPMMDSLKGLRWGAAEGTTQIDLIAKLVGPTQQVMQYNDVADSLEALKANQIDAVMMDLPSALYATAVQLEDGVVLGQFENTGEAAGGAGMLMEKDKALKACVDEALAAMKADGKLKAIEAEWLQTATGAPLIK
jgi:polar amino acid transport system substrate-binding protein